MTYPIPTSAELGHQQSARLHKDSAALHGGASNIEKVRARSESVSFWDFVDVINPLQHIPVVNAIYRDMTGDIITPTARVAGGALFGGFIGAAIGAVNVVAEMKTDRDIGEHVMDKLDIHFAENEQAEKHEVLPVVEVRPIASARPQAPAIFWDDEKPVVLAAVAGAPKEKITWNDTQTAAAQLDAVAPAAGYTAIRDVPVHNVMHNDMSFAAAMPSPKELNDLEPGTPADIAVEKQTDQQQALATQDALPAEIPVPQAMAQALEKYATMQNDKQNPLVVASKRDDGAHAALADGEVFIPAVKASERIAVKTDAAVAAREAFQGFRRYR